MLGLAFKPNTDDMREAPSLVLIDLLKKAGCNIRVYDPVAMEEAKRRIGNDVHYCHDVYETIEQADALLLARNGVNSELLIYKKLKN